jgi:nucleoside-diphosphate-sugar epimerase
MRVFVAGASGVIGRRLVPLLVAAGHEVTGTTRSPEKLRELEELGATPVVVDAFDAPALAAAVRAAQSQVVIHQLTDLPDSSNPVGIVASLGRNTRIRIEGTRNLIAAALAAGAKRLIAQSLAFIYADGPEPHAETDPLASDRGVLPQAVTARGVRALEEMATGTPGLPGLVLRYGRLYGPGTWTETPPPGAPLHVDAAAHAARLAVERGAPGIYNIAENDGGVTIEKARRELAFDPNFRMS